MTAAFVTATGTGVGKTFVTAGLIHYFRRLGRTVDALKPIVSGFDADETATSDPGILLSALGRPVGPHEIARISPWRFLAPLSPDMAAAQEGRFVDFSALVAFSGKALADAANVILIEGAGGIMAPIDEQHTMLDWMQELGAPTILVAGSYLGTISHTLSALDALRHRDCDPRAIVVSETPDCAVPFDATIATIARFAGSVEVIGLPRLSRAEERHPAFERIAHRL